LFGKIAKKDPNEVNRDAQEVERKVDHLSSMEVPQVNKILEVKDVPQQQPELMYVPLSLGEKS
jgi:hypothetical protein